MTKDQDEDQDVPDRAVRDTSELPITSIGEVVIPPQLPEERQFQPSLIFIERLGTIAGPLLSKYTDGRWLESDRPRGVLSKTDREFLLGRKEYAHKQSRSNRKQTIRERVKHSIYDFTLLWMYLPPVERGRVFETVQDTDVETSIESLITFAYLSVGQDVTEMERRIENGILAGAVFDPESNEDGEVTDVDVSIDISVKPRITELEHKLEERADELTPEEIGILVKLGELEPDDLKTLEEGRAESLQLSGGVEETEETNSDE